MISPECIRCSKPLVKFGALLFSPPVDEIPKDPCPVDKFHICASCYEDVILFLIQGTEEDIKRASGDCICGPCGKKYSEHPLDLSRLDYYDNPFLNRLCDGRLVKL